MISVVIPALNEEKNIGIVLRAMPREVDEVIVVDGGSKDDTVEAALDNRHDVVVVSQRGKGKGDALRAGFLATTGDKIIMMDADGSTNPAEIPSFAAALDRADFVKGSRYMGGSADFSVIRDMGNRFLNSIVNYKYKTSFTDLCYGYMGFNRYCLGLLEASAPGFEIETLLVMQAISFGFSIEEIPSYELPRISGESNLSPIRDGFRILSTIVKS